MLHFPEPETVQQALPGSLRLPLRRSRYRNGCRPERACRRSDRFCRVLPERQTEWVLPPVWECLPQSPELPASLPAHRSLPALWAERQAFPGQPEQAQALPE